MRGIIVGLLALASTSAWSSDRLGPTTMCGGTLVADAPVVGLWRVDDYREVMGGRGFFSPGDLLLIRSAGDGSLCMELTREVVGSSYFRLQATEAGSVIDNEVVAMDGSKLKLMLKAGGDRSLSILVRRAGTGDLADVGTGIALAVGG